VRHDERHEGDAEAEALGDLGAVAVGGHADIGPRHAGLGERAQRQKGRRGVASLAGHEPGGPEGRAVELGQGVHGAAGRHGRVGVPSLARRGAAQAEGPRQVEDPAAGGGRTAPGAGFTVV